MHYVNEANTLLIHSNRIHLNRGINFTCRPGARAFLIDYGVRFSLARVLIYHFIGGKNVYFGTMTIRALFKFPKRHLQVILGNRSYKSYIRCL